MMMMMMIMVWTTPRIRFGRLKGDGEIYARKAYSFFVSGNIEQIHIKILKFDTFINSIIMFIQLFLLFIFLVFDI